MDYRISQELFNKIVTGFSSPQKSSLVVNYLMTRPWIEVNSLIVELTQDLPPVEEVIPGEVKNDSDS